MNLPLYSIHLIQNSQLIFRQSKMHLTYLFFCFAIFASAFSAPFEISLQRKSAILPQQEEIQEWLGKAAEELENGKLAKIGPKCPFRNLPGIRNLLSNEKKENSAAEVPIIDFVDTFLVGQISVGTPPQKFDVILDSTMFVLYGVPANFLIDIKTCEFGRELPCEKMRLFDPSQSSTFSKWPSIKNYSLAKDIVSFGNAKAESNFLLLNGKEFVGPRSFDLIYQSGAPGIPRLDGIFSLAFTTSLMPIKSGMEYLLANEENKIATIYIEPLKSLDFTAKQGGMVTVGGLDKKRCENSWEWNSVPLLANRWKIPMKTVEYGDFHFYGGEAFFSTFHTFIYGPKKALAPLLNLVKPIKEPIAGKEPKNVAIECDRTNLPDIIFHFGNRKYTLTPEQYVLDVVLDPNDHSKNICHLMILPIPDDLPDIKALMKPADWFFGQLFFNQFCVAFDYTSHKQKIGLSPHKI